MQPISFDRISYRIAGRPVTLVSGEVHYFRVPRADWRTRMQLLKDAGANCLATYIPWLIHEPSEGRFVFQSDDGRANLEEFLLLARELELYVIARPGPYQYSELINAGLPTWLVTDYAEILAKNLAGEVFNPSSVSYVHPLFLAKTRRWFDAVCPIIARHTVSRGGAVAFTQIDNELTGIHEWSGSLDYHPTSMGFGERDGRYTKFLRTRYADIAALNAAYGTTYTEFTDIRPVAPGATTTEEIRRGKDYFDFYLGTVAEYAVTLRDWMRSHGIDTPIIHNAANPGMNVYFRETIRALGDDFLLGSDHYYNLSQDWPQNNPTPQYAARTFFSCETLRLMGFPPTVMEMPSGSFSDWPAFSPRDAAACYWANLALGVKGSNFYIFTGGTNPPGCGTTSDVYDFSAPIGPKGEIRPLYYVQQQWSTFMTSHPTLPRMQRECDVRCLLNMEYPRSWNYWRSRGPMLFSAPDAHDFLIKGIVTTSFCAGLSPAMCDADSDAWLADTSTPVIVPTSVSMAESIQRRVVRFIQNGGRVLLAPVIPMLDENLQPCTILADALGRPAVSSRKNIRSRLDIAGVENVFNNGDAFFCDAVPDGAEIVGRDALSGTPIAWRVSMGGGGAVLFCGLRWSQGMREHERMLGQLLAQLGLSRRIDSTNPNLWTSMLSADGTALVCVMNLTTSPAETHLTIHSAERAGVVDLGRIGVEAMSVTVIEVNSAGSRTIVR